MPLLNIVSDTLRNLGWTFQPDKRAFVEDTVAGITAATAAGMYAIGLASGPHADQHYRDQLRRAGAFTVIDSLSALRTQLDDPTLFHQPA